MIGRKRVVRKRSGFTLVELMVVMILLALLSATAALWVRQPLAKSQRQHAMSQLRSLDAIARQRARGRGGVNMIMDVRRSEVNLVDAQGRRLTAPLAIPNGYKFEAIIGAEESGTSGRVIRYDRYGTSRSFALTIEKEGTERHWLLVLGMTGQSYVLQDERQIRAIIGREQRNHTR